MGFHLLATMSSAFHLCVCLLLCAAVGSYASCTDKWADYCSKISNRSCYKYGAEDKECCKSCAQYKTGVAGCEFGNQDGNDWCGTGPAFCKRLGSRAAERCCTLCGSGGGAGTTTQRPATTTNSGGNGGGDDTARIKARR